MMEQVLEISHGIAELSSRCLSFLCLRPKDLEDKKLKYSCGERRFLDLIYAPGSLQANENRICLVSLVEVSTPNHSGAAKWS